MLALHHSTDMSAYRIKPVSGKRILFVMAAEPEYGPHLRERFMPLMTGIGPVESAVVLSAELSLLANTDQKPDCVVSLGSAGSPSLEQTAVYQVSSVSYRDMDASPLGFEKGCTPLLDLPAIVDLPLKIPGLPAASLATGASIVSGTQYNTIEADMVDMETFAILRCCQRFDVPLIGLRGISDGDSELGHLDDWTQYLHIIDEKLAAAIDQLELSIHEGRLF